MKMILMIIGLNSLFLMLTSCEKNSLEENIISNIILYDGFENDSLIWFTQTARQSNISISNSVSPRYGSKSLHFQVFKSDPWIANGPRSEIFRPKGIEYWKDGDEVWIGGSVFFPENYIDDPMQEIIWQIHDEETGVPFLIQSVDSNLVIKGKNINQKTILREKGKWIDIVTHHKWSSTNSGLTQVFIDGELLIDAKGIANMTEGTSIYIKFGIYKSGWKFEGDTLSNTDYRELWYDEIRIGNSNSSFTEVSPR